MLSAVLEVDPRLDPDRPINMPEIDRSLSDCRYWSAPTSSPASPSFVRPTRRTTCRFALNNDEFCIDNDDFCIKNDGLCIRNDEFCIETDELFIQNDGLLEQRSEVRGAIGSDLH